MIGVLLALHDPGILRRGLAVALIGFGGAGVFSLHGAIIGQRFGTENFGLIPGMCGLLHALAGTGGPFAGAIRDRLDSHDPFFVASALILPISELFTFLAPPGISQSVSGRPA